MTEIGDNSGIVAEPLAADRLRSFVERYERIDEEVAERRADQKDLMQEIASAGFDKKAVRQLIRIRKMDPAEVEEQETLLDVYRRALGM
ncbi:MAG TPA: DUF2312 domain-containing protein [Acetobacteraceae bacterium]|nr:DUF2312 domain-containing protein [Acetobacteraceae bacterium]